MKPGEIVYRPPGGGLPIELTTATPELLATRLTDMDLAVLAACLRVISSRVVTATTTAALVLENTSGTYTPAVVSPRGTPIRGGENNAEIAAALAAAAADDGDPFR